MQFHTVTEPGGEPRLTATQENGHVQLASSGKQGARYAIERAHAVSAPWILASHDKLSRAARTSFFLYDVRRDSKVGWEPAVPRAKNASATTRG